MTGAGRFYAAGAAVVFLLIFTAATWWNVQEENARVVAAGAFGGSLLVAAILGVMMTRSETSSLRQDPRAPGTPAYWRLLLGAVFLSIFDEALSGVPIFSATGFMTGLIGTILAVTAHRARMHRRSG